MAIDGRLGQAVRCAAEADAVVVGETTLFAQDLIDAERWKRVGVPPDRITVTGSMKYDAEDLAADIDLRFSAWLEKHGVNAGRPILLGGSLHPGEEDLLLSGFQLLLAEFPSLFLILVPRHVERIPEIVQLLRARNARFTLRSEPDFQDDPSVLLVNTTGELKDWYSAATVVVVGKSFYGSGRPIESSRFWPASLWWSGRTWRVSNTSSATNSATPGG